MKRQSITNGNGQWFNIESAEVIKEDTFWNGQNWISKATGSQWEHESLYRTKGKVWILNHWSNYQGSIETYEIINNSEAAAWLAKQEMEPHPACEKEYNEFEIL